MTPGMSRRKALTGAALLGVTPALAACGGDEEPGGTAAGSGSSGSGGGGSFATTADIPEGGGAIFADEGIVVTQPAAGEFKAFTNICTHRQCPLSDVTETINCQCHGSQFSIEDGSAQTGPATDPLTEMAITVDGDAISLA